MEGTWTLDGFVLQIFSDVAFFMAVDRSANLLGRYNAKPTYYYHYAHRSNMSLGSWMGLTPDIDLGFYRIFQGSKKWNMTSQTNYSQVFYTGTSCSLCSPIRYSLRPVRTLMSKRRNCWSTCGPLLPLTGSVHVLNAIPLLLFNKLIDRIPESDLASIWQPMGENERRILNIDTQNAGMITDLPFHYRLPYWNYILNEQWRNLIFRKCFRFVGSFPSIVTSRL